MFKAAKNGPDTMVRLTVEVPYELMVRLAELGVSRVPETFDDELKELFPPSWSDGVSTEVLQNVLDAWKLHPMNPEFVERLKATGEDLMDDMLDLFTHVSKFFEASSKVGDFDPDAWFDAVTQRAIDTGVLSREVAEALGYMGETDETVQS